MHQRGIHRRRVRLRPRSHTRRGMRSDLKFNNKQNKECLRELEDNDPRMKFDMILKCFDMYCDQYDMHCGEHTDIMKECINSYSFRAMLETCQERACELWKTQKKYQCRVLLLPGHTPVSCHCVYNVCCLLIQRLQGLWPIPPMQEGLAA